MLPPVDDRVLRENPEFHKLYQRLVTTALNPDGSTKQPANSTSHGKAKKELDEHRLNQARKHVLIAAVASATPPPAAAITSRLPNQSQSETADALSDLLFLLPSLLEREQPVSREVTQLLFAHPPFSCLEALLPDLSAAVSTTLRGFALNLCRAIHPTTNPSYLHRHISTLSDDISSLLAQQRDAHTRLLSERLETISLLRELLDTHVLSVTQLIRTLEAKHGAVARNLELRAQEVSVEARRSQAETEKIHAEVHSSVYSPETITALQNYAAHLQDARVRAAERIKGLHAELAEFGVGVDEGRERIMRTLAKEYAKMIEERKEIRGDLERLQDR